MKLQLSIIQCPIGVFSYVGSVPSCLGEAVAATRADVMGGRSFFGPNRELLTIKFPNFPTRNAAVAHAVAKGVAIAL